MCLQSTERIILKCRAWARALVSAFASCWCWCCQREILFPWRQHKCIHDTGVSSYSSFSFHVKRFPILDMLPTLHLSFSPGLLKIRTCSSCGSPDFAVRGRYFIKIVSWPILFWRPTSTTSWGHLDLGHFLRVPVLILQWRTGHQSKTVATMWWANEYPKIQPLVCLKKQTNKNILV